MDGQDSRALRGELEALRDLLTWTRGQLLSVRPGSWQAAAGTAVAAAAAELTHRCSDELPAWRNEVSELWRRHLGRVWAYLAGDEQQYPVLCAAIAEHLTGPFNHQLGQDGPDDFDRPQTIASYAATCSAVFWGTDFAVTAVGQVFDCIDLKYDGEHPPGRSSDVDAAIRRLRAAVERVVSDLATGPAELSPQVLDEIRSPL